MLHTFQVTWRLNDHHMQYMKIKCGIDIKNITEFVRGNFESMTVKVNVNEYNIAWMSLIVDVPLLLNRGEIVDSDYEKVASTIKAMLAYTFGDSKMFDDHYLVRFDYRLDRIVKCKDVRQLYISLYKKTCSKNNRLRKIDGKLNDYGDFEKYDASMYHSSKSVHTILYDKEAERHKKGEAIKRWEKDVMRFEVRLLKQHLKYKRTAKKNPIPRNIKSYFKREIMDKYVEEYLKRAYIQGDFNTFEKAESIINTTTLVDMTSTIKSRMKEFVRDVSASNLDLPKRKVSPTIFTQRLKLFHKMNLHPITIPKTKIHIASYLESLL